MGQFNPFQFSGRIGRLQYFGFGVIWGLIFSFVAIAMGIGLENSTTSSSPVSAGSALATLLFTVVYAVATLSYGVRRLHDFDKSGWWYLLMFVPFANVIMAFVLLLAPGTQGANRYGARVGAVAAG